jgi:hypothetical protein
LGRIIDFGSSDRILKRTRVNSSKFFPSAFRGPTDLRSYPRSVL